MRNRYLPDLDDDEIVRMAYDKLKPCRQCGVENIEYLIFSSRRTKGGGSEMPGINFYIECRCPSHNHIIDNQIDRGVIGWGKNLRQAISNAKKLWNEKQKGAKK